MPLFQKTLLEENQKAGEPNRKVIWGFYNYCNVLIKATLRRSLSATLCERRSKVWTVNSENRRGCRAFKEEYDQWRA